MEEREHSGLVLNAHRSGPQQGCEIDQGDQGFSHKSVNGDLFRSCRINIWGKAC